MSLTRRDLVKLASVGMGSLAAAGLGANPAEACWWLQKRRPILPGTQPIQSDKPAGDRGPEIIITSLISGATIGRTFTVYGTYDEGGRPVASINCTISSRVFGAIFSNGSWMADITVPNPPIGGTSGLSLHAEMALQGVVTTYSADVSDLTLANDAPNPNPLEITGPHRDRKDLIEEPYGKAGDGIFLVSSVYISTKRGSEGTPVGHHQFAQPKNKAWKAKHKHLPKGAKASYVATGIGFDQTTKKFIFFTSSVTGCTN